MTQPFSRGASTPPSPAVFVLQCCWQADSSLTLAAQTLKQKGYKAVTDSNIKWFERKWREKYETGTECATPYTLFSGTP